MDSRAVLTLVALVASCAPAGPDVAPPRTPAVPSDPSPEPRTDGERRVEAVLAVVDGSTGAALQTGWKPLVDGLLVQPDGEASLRVEAWTPPQGFGGMKSIAWDGKIAARARSVRFSERVFPLGDVAVRCVEAAAPGAAPAAAARVAAATSRLPRERREAATTFEASAPDADGVLRVRLPRIPYQLIALRVTRPDPDVAQGLLAGEACIFDDSFGGPPRITVVLAEVEPSGGYFGTGHLPHWDCGTRLTVEPTASMTVRAVHADGRPAAGVSVRMLPNWRSAVTDGHGVARVGPVAVGEARLVASAHGFRPTFLRAVVGRDGEVAVREASARIVRVVVVDAGDRPLPAARVTSESATIVDSDGNEVRVGGCSVAQLDGDVEFVGPLTGADGSLTLQEPAGVVRYVADLGGGLATVESADDVVRIVMKRD